MPSIREQAAERHSELADLEGEASRKLLSRLFAEYEDIPAHALPGSIKSLDVSAAVNRDKAALLRGENPERPAAMRSAAEVVRSLQATGFDPRKLRFTQTKTLEVDPESDKPEAIEGSVEEGTITMSEAVRLSTPDIVFKHGIKETPEVARALDALDKALDAVLALDGVSFEGKRDWRKTA